MVKLSSEHIKLRAPESTDLEVFFAWENDPDVWLITQTQSPFSRDTLRSYLENAHKDLYEYRQLRMVIEDVNADRPLGTVDFFDFDPANKRVGVGVFIALPADRRHGYAREALAVALDFAFEQYDLEQVYCNILSSNEASLNLFGRLGFETVGLKKRWVREGSRWHDEYLLQKLKESK